MMTTARTRNRRGVVWAIVGGAVMLAGIVTIIVVALMSRPADTLATPAPTASASNTTTTPRPGTPDEVVDPSAMDRGWTAEPITPDPEAYVRAALAAASTFDTTLSSRNEWLTYLDSWFTVDTRYTSEADQQDELDAAQLELRQAVVLPEQQWDSLAGEDGRVVASVDGPVALSPVPDDTTGDMSIGTADVVLTYTRADTTGTETTFEETVRVSVQVLCGPASVPTPDTAQRPGDCKVVRFFTEPMEP